MENRVVLNVRKDKGKKGMWIRDNRIQQDNGCIDYIKVLNEAVCAVRLFSREDGGVVWRSSETRILTWRNI